MSFKFKTTEGKYFANISKDSGCKRVECDATSMGDAVAQVKAANPGWYIHEAYQASCLGHEDELPVVS